MSDKQQNSFPDALLCVFPSLPQALVIDVSDSSFQILSIDIRNLIDAGFKNNLQEKMMISLSDPDIVINDLLVSIPQQLEESIRGELFRSLVRILEADVKENLKSGALSVVFFTGDILWSEHSRWRMALTNMLRDRVSEENMENLLTRLEGLVSEERRLQGKSMRGSLDTSGGDDAEKGYVTIWHRNAGKTD